MPNYASSLTRAISPGDIVTLFDAETVTQGESSIAVAIPPIPGQGAPQFSLYLHFASAPTAVTTVQVANADADADYVGTGTNSTNKQTDQLNFTSNAPFLRINVGTFSAGGVMTATLYRAN